MPQLHRLTYMSRPSQGLGDDDITRILRVARTRNQPDHLTGYLAFNGAVFLQLLEGEPAALTNCLTRLLRDPRHREVELLGFEPTDQRLFPDWGMGYVAMAGQHEGLVRRFCSGGQIVPGNITAGGLTQLLSELSQLDAAAKPVWDTQVARMA